MKKIGGKLIIFIVLMLIFGLFGGTIVMLSKGNIFKQYAKAQLEADIKSESLNFSYDIKEKNGKNMQILIKQKKD